MSKSEDDIFRERQAIEGKKGGDTTNKRHGSAFYSRIAKERHRKERLAKKKNGK